jgi:hypothetical protein
MKMEKIPILVLAFNRADHVSEAMKAIREYKPERLYLECDGPRSHKEGEKEAVEATRKAMLNSVDWPCKVETLFREENMGCAHAVNDAITWFFSKEEYGIICEDDMVLGQDFFKFCEKLLPRYANNERIMSISSQNLSHRTDINNTYVYSCRQSCWGWASWSRAWKKMDMSMSAVPSLTYSFLFKKLGFFEGYMWKRNLTKAYNNIETFNSWATRWFLSVLVNEGLVIVPGVNLGINIGFDGGAHYTKDDIDPYEDLQIGHLGWPLFFNDSFSIDWLQSKYDEREYKRIKMLGLRKKINTLLRKIK